LQSATNTAACLGCVCVTDMDLGMGAMKRRPSFEAATAARMRETQAAVNFIWFCCSALASGKGGQLALANALWEKIDSGCTVATLRTQASDLEERLLFQPVGRWKWQCFGLVLVSLACLQDTEHSEGSRDRIDRPVILITKIPGGLPPAFSSFIHFSISRHLPIRLNGRAV
jgi:hypothetical protein